MDKDLFKPKPSLFIRSIKGLFVWIVIVVILPGIIVVALTFGLHWWKNTKFVDKLTYKWALEEQYNNGRHHERLCTILLKDRKDPLNLTQKSFCDRHNNYKDHPQSLGD